MNVSNEKKGRQVAAVEVIQDAPDEALPALLAAVLARMMAPKPAPEPVAVVEPDKWLTPPEVAERMGSGTSLATVYRLVRAKKLAASRALGGNVIRVSASALDAFMRSGVDSPRRIAPCE